MKLNTINIAIVDLKAAVPLVRFPLKGRFSRAPAMYE